MSNDWINVRFGARHFIITTRPFQVRFVVNSYWTKERQKTWFQVFTLFGKHY